MSETSDTTGLRIPKAVNERMKSYAAVLGCSVSELGQRALGAIMDQMDGDEREPLLVAEYKLKKSYATDAGKGSPARKKAR